MRAAASSFDVAAWSSHWAFDGYGPWLERLRAAPSHAAAQLSSILGTAVVFDHQPGKLAAGLDAKDVDDSYADRCVRGVVPTRPDNLHDLLNAVTWARFPRAKRALCQRQVRLARERGVVTTSPRVRTREQDACAMVDEGGMILGRSARAIFGHAALEDAVLGRALRPFLIHVDDDDLDAGLAAVLDDPRPIPRVRERHVVLVPPLG